jgi:ribonucleoside-diphosphate reductase alpha chain
MVNDLKYYDGSVQASTASPGDLKEIYATAFEVDRAGWWMPPAAARSGSTRPSR